MAEIDILRKYLADAKRIVAFTGAGISTESGIPDFRSPGGLWTKYQPIEFRDFLASEDMRRETWRRKFATDSIMQKATPNAGHKVLARLVEDGRMRAIITQNVDGLHQASGVPANKVIELHGNSTCVVCLDCQRRYELDWVRSIFDNNEILPVCADCNDILKTTTISFGQPMPQATMEYAREIALQANLMIALGSSLVVFPAASFPILAKRNGAEYIIINREPTEQDQLADLVIHGEIGAIMSRAVCGD